MLNPLKKEDDYWMKAYENLKKQAQKWQGEYLSLKEEKWKAEDLSRKEEENSAKPPPPSQKTLTSTPKTPASTLTPKTQTQTPTPTPTLLTEQTPTLTTPTPTPKTPTTYFMTSKKQEDMSIQNEIVLSLREKDQKAKFLFPRETNKKLKKDLEEMFQKLWNSYITDLNPQYRNEKIKETKGKNKENLQKFYVNTLQKEFGFDFEKILKSQKDNLTWLANELVHPSVVTVTRLFARPNEYVGILTEETISDQKLNLRSEKEFAISFRKGKKFDYLIVLWSSSDPRFQNWPKENKIYNTKSKKEKSWSCAFTVGDSNSLCSFLKNKYSLLQKLKEVWIVGIQPTGSNFPDFTSRFISEYIVALMPWMFPGFCKKEINYTARNYTAKDVFDFFQLWFCLQWQFSDAKDLFLRLSPPLFPL